MIDTALAGSVNEAGCCCSIWQKAGGHKIMIADHLPEQAKRVLKDLLV